MFTRLSEFQSMSVHAFNILALAHAQLLIVASTWTTKLLADAALLKPVTVLGRWGEPPSLWRAKALCIAVPQGPAVPPEEGS